MQKIGEGITMKKLCAALACLALLVSLALTGAQAALSYPFTTVKIGRAS